MKVKKTQRRRSADLQLLSLAICIAMPAFLSAQNVNSLLDDFNNNQKQRVATVSSDASDFGESTEMKTGQTSFRHVDVVIPANGQLALTVSRRLDIAESRIGKPEDQAADGPLMGNWELELPHLSGFYDERTGWAVSQANRNTRCSPNGTGNMLPPTVSSQFSAGSKNYYADDYWSGVQLKLPGRGSTLLLQADQSTVEPTDGQEHHWTTRENDRLGCVDQIKNGVGQGFKLKTADGLTYTFDWMASRDAVDLEDTQCVSTAALEQFQGERNQLSRMLRPILGPPAENEGRSGPISDGASSLQCQKRIVVKLREQMLFATRVEDRFGNWTAYDFDPANPRRVTAIRNSDGAALRFTYNAQGKVATVTDGIRTWRYSYAGTDLVELTAVTQPDATQWHFSYPNISRLLDHKEGKVRWFDCQPSVAPTTAQVLMTHPMGATAEFSFTRMLHGTDRTPGGCSVPDPDRPNRINLSEGAMAYRVGSLTSKRISGVASPDAVWTYRYEPNWSWNDSGYVDLCATADCAGGTSVTEITRPDGTVERLTFGNDYWRNTGQLLVKAVVSGGRTVREERYEYLASSQGQNFPDAYGVDLLGGKNNPFITEKIRPLVKTTVIQDGTTFVTETPLCGTTARCIDRFARSTRVERSNSAGHFKSEETRFHDDLDDWVLGNVASLRDPVRNLVIEETEFDERALPVLTRNFGQLTARLQYGTDGNLKAVSDALGNTIMLSDWRRGRASRVQFPSTASAPTGAVETQQVDDLGLVVSSVNAAGGRSTFEYDAMGRLLRSTPPGGDVVTRVPTVYTYHRLTAADWRPAGISVGQWRVYEGTGNRAKFTYLDALQRPVLVQEYDTADPSKTLSYTRIEYDALGRKVFVSYPQRSAEATAIGIRTRFDALGREIEVSRDSELGRRLTQRTDYLPGLTIRSTDELGNSTLTEHMAWDDPTYDMPIYQASPEGVIAVVDRDPYFGRALSFTRHRHGEQARITRHHVYDASGRLCKTVEPETGARVFEHDSNGNVVSVASGLRGASYQNLSSCSQAEARASGRMTRLSYDAMGRLISSVKPDGDGSQQLTYTVDGLLASVETEIRGERARRIVNAFRYDNARQIVAESLSQTGWYTWTVEYRRDSLGNIASTRYPTGLVVDYAPNALGQPTRAGTFATNVEYEPSGAIRRFVYGNGITYLRESNIRGLPSRVSSSGVLDLAFTYDAAGNVSRIADTMLGSRNDRAMAYDARGRLISVQSQAFGGDGQYQITYDAFDNVRSKRIPGVSGHSRFEYTTNNLLDRILTPEGSTALEFSWDEAGNIARRGQQEFRFRSDGKLRDVVGQATYLYDSGNNRVQASYADGRTALWFYDGSGRQIFASDFTSPGQSNQKVYQSIYLGKMLVATIDQAWPSNASLGTRYHHPDHLGSPLAVTNSSGALLARNEFGPYGESSNPTMISTVGYGGHGVDTASSLVYMGARYYDPASGRFVSADPVLYSPDASAGFNRYQYAANNPLTLLDPDGRQERTPLLIERLANRFHNVVEASRNIHLDASITYEAKVGVSGDAPGGKVEMHAGKAEVITRRPLIGPPRPMEAEIRYQIAGAEVAIDNVGELQGGTPISVTKARPNGARGSVTTYESGMNVEAYNLPSLGLLAAGALNGEDISFHLPDGGRDFEFGGATLFGLKFGFHVRRADDKKPDPLPPETVEILPKPDFGR